MDTVELVLIDPADLHCVWSDVRHGMEISSRFSNGEWIPEDCYTMIKQGRASLYIWYVGTIVGGHIVLMKLPTNKGSSMHVFTLYVEKQYSDQIDCNMYKMDDIAHRNKCHKIVFHSPRNGWDRRGARLGFKPVTTIYEKDLT